MPLPTWFRSATRLFAVFAIVTTTFAGAQVWVSWLLIRQDRELERQRRQDQLDQVLDAAAAGLLRTPSEREQQVARLADTPPDALQAGDPRAWAALRLRSGAVPSDVEGRLATRGQVVTRSRRGPKGESRAPSFSSTRPAGRPSPWP